MRKILCLHGYTQNAAIFKRKTAVLRNHILKKVSQACISEGGWDLVYVDAPHQVPEQDLIKFQQDHVPRLDAQQGIKETSAQDILPRTWWVYDGHSYTGLTDSMHYLKTILEEQGPFSGIFGFSQGAAMAALVTRHVEQSFSDWPVIQHPPFDFSIICSGFKSRDAHHASLFKEPFHTRSLHIIGLQDQLVMPDRSLALAHCFQSPLIYEHDGGHFVPSDAKMRTALFDFLVGVYPSASNL